MTRLFTDGAEMQDTLFWSVSNAGVLTVASATPAISPYYYYLNSDVMWKSFSAISEIYVRMRVRFTGTGWNGSGARYFQFRLAGVAVAWLQFDGAGKIIAVVTTVGTVETSAFVPVKDTWYLFEIRFKEAEAPNGRFVVYVDGNKIIDYTGDTQPAAATTFDNMYFSLPTNVVLLNDDIAINDTAEGVDNSWCGDGIVVKITPSGSSTVNNWVNSGSVSGSANYLYVDEYPSDTTTYTHCSASSTGVKDKYAMSNLGGGIGNITRIFSEARIKKEAADSTTVKLGYLPDGGTDTMSGSIALYTTYAQAIGTSASANPVTGLAWTVADVNALEYVIEMS